MMRTWLSGSSSVVATPERAMYGTWVDDQTVTLSPLPLGDRRVWLDRDGVGHVGDVALLHDRVGRRQRCLDVALHDRRARGVVAFTDDVLRGRVARPALVDERRAVGERGLDVAHDRKRLVVDVDQRRGLAGDLGGRGRDRRDDLALVAHDVAGEERAVLDERAVADVGHVVLGEDAEHAGERPCASGVDRADPRVGVVGVPEARVEHPGHRQVGGVAAEACDLVLAVRPDELRAVPLSPRGLASGFGNRLMNTL